MEILLNSLLSFFVLTASTNLALGQQLDTIDVYTVSVADIDYNTPMDSIEKRLGKPMEYSVYEEEEGEAEGYDKWFYFTYNSLQLTFYEWSRETYLFSFNINSNQYTVKLGNMQVSVDDSIKILQEHFPNSYHEFISRQNPDNNQVEDFYIRIAIPYLNAISYDGIINIKILENKVIGVSASFRPA